MFGFKHGFWTNLIANMMCTRLQNYANMMVGKHGIQTFEVIVVVLLFFVVVLKSFCPHEWTPLILFGQAICPNMFKCQLDKIIWNWEPSCIDYTS